MIKFIENIMRNSKLIGAISLMLSIVTWGLDLPGIISPCAYCRVQRTIIGIVGLIMFLPAPTRLHWITLFVANILAFFGANVAVNQNFLIWLKLSTHQISLASMLSNISFWMSLGALIFIAVQVMVLNKFQHQSAR